MHREPALKVVPVVVGLVFVAGVYPLILMGEARPGAGDDDEPLRHARYFLDKWQPETHPRIGA